MIAGNGATGLAKLAQPLQLACYFILSKESQVANQKMGLDAGLGLGAASQLGEPGKKGLPCSRDAPLLLALLNSSMRAAKPCLGHFRIARAALYLFPEKDEAGYPAPQPQKEQDGGSVQGLQPHVPGSAARCGKRPPGRR